MKSSASWTKLVAGVAVAAIAASAANVASAGSASYTYDNLGRLVKVSYSTGVVITYTYDAAGNRTATVVTGAPS